MSGLISGAWLLFPAAASNTAQIGSSENLIQISQAPSVGSTTPVAITGQLDSNSPTLSDDGSYYQEHMFEGTVGEEITIELSSDEFDTYLILQNPAGETIAENDDGISGTDSTIVVTLPTTGVYTTLANSRGEGETGRYRLERRAAIATDRLLVEAGQLNQQVVELRQSGNYSEAIPIAERALSIREEVLGESHPGVAIGLNSLARLYQAQSRYEEAAPLFQRSLLIWEESVGENHPYTAGSLNNLASLYEAQGRYEEAEPLYQRSLSIWEKLVGERHPEVATVLNNLGGLYQAQGRYEEAEPLHQRSLSIREESLGERHPDVASSLNNLAGLYESQGRYEEAEPLYQRALSIWEESLGESHPDVATVLNNLGGLYESQGRYEEAEPLYQRALSIWEESLGESHPDVATVLNNLGGLYESQGRYEEAEPLYQRALSVREESLGESHPDVATSLNNLAGLYESQGRYGEAEPLYQRALSVREESLGESHPDVAISLNNLSELYRSQGRYEEIEPLLQRSLSIWEKSLGKSHPNVATSLNNLAGLYESQGRYEEAEPLYQRALSIREESLGKSHPDVAISLNNLAGLYQSQGRYEETEPLLQRSLSIWEETLGERHPNVATVLNNLAGLYLEQKYYEKARPLYQLSLSIREEALGRNHPDVASSLINLSTLSWTQSDFEATLTQLQQGLFIEEGSLNLNLVGGSESSKQDFLNTFINTKDSVVSLHLQELGDSPDAANLALSTILQRKGRLLDIFTNSQQVLREQLDSKSQELLTDLEVKRTQLSVLFYNRPESLPLNEYRNQVSNLESQIQNLEDQLSRRSSRFQALNQPIDLPTIQALLPEKSTLIELVRYQPFNPTATSHNRYGEARYAAYLVKPEGDVEGVDLGTVAEIDPLIEDLQRALRNPGFTVEEVKETAQALDARVMAPIRQQLGNTKHLLLSPDGAFNLIPFETLVDEEEDYLVENYTLTYLTSGRDLLRLQATANSQTEPLLLANPIFEQPGNLKVAQTRYASLRDRNWPVLSGTGQEADRIAAQFTQEVQNLQGSAATEASLKQANRPRFLHIATHGFFEPINPAEDVSTDNPLLRSGLVLSGINVGESGSAEDGIVSALEVSSLNLLGTKLAVLSACETGLGDLSLGEGVYGLRRALILAGSESQLISLWRVQDDTTRDLMVEYYEHLLSGVGRSEALRQTQLAMLKDEATAHPYYWAAFINSGDWRPISEQ